MLAFIAGYAPAAENAVLAAPLRPFVPDLQPAVHAPDDFIKVRGAGHGSPRANAWLYVGGTSECVVRPLAASLLPTSSLQPPRPDGADETLGLRIIDEPAPVQSDPALLELQLRAATRRTVASDAVAVRSLARAESQPREVNAWIAAINGACTAGSVVEV